MGKQHSFGLVKAALGHSVKKGFEFLDRGQKGHPRWRERLRQTQRWDHVMCDISVARVTGGQWHRQKGTWDQLLVQCHSKPETENLGLEAGPSS